MFEYSERENNIFKKKLFMGIKAVFDVTPPELIKIKHSVNSSYSISNKLPISLLNLERSSKIKCGTAIFPCQAFFSSLFGSSSSQTFKVKSNPSCFIIMVAS